MATDFFQPFGLDSDELRLEQKGWEPETYEEWVDAYKAVIELMVVKLETYQSYNVDNYHTYLDKGEGEGERVW